MNCQDGKSYWKQRHLEKPHWLLIDKAVKGIRKSYKDQHEMAINSGGYIPGLTEIAIGILMDSIRSVNKKFNLKCPNIVDPVQPYNVRFKESQKDDLILNVHGRFDGIYIYDCPHKDAFYDNVGFLLAKKSF